MSLKNYRFKPSLRLTALTLILLPILISLGIWQLHRADYKAHLQAQYNTRAQMPPRWLSLVIPQADNHYLPVKLQGRFDTQHLIFLDNKIHNHQPGYQVLSPLRYDPQQPAVLVNLGWIAQGRDRSHLPSLKLPTEAVLLAGIIAKLPQKGFALGANTDLHYQTWPLRLQQLDKDYLTQKLGYPIQPFMILLAPAQPYGFVRDWAPASLNPQMHLGYAVQWFALAVTLVILFIISSLKRR